MYKKAKKRGRKKDWEETQKLRKEIYQELQQAYANYINRLLDPEEDKPGAIKRFYRYIKHLRQESTGVSTPGHLGWGALSAVGSLIISGGNLGGQGFSTSVLLVDEFVLQVVFWCSEVYLMYVYVCRCSVSGLPTCQVGRWLFESTDH